MPKPLTPTGILNQRLANQHLIGQPPSKAEDVVRELLAVQSQDYAGAKWGVGQRTKNATDATLDRAYNEGKIVRTHVMRPTWHFVTPEDIRWLLDLTAPRVRALLAYYDRNLEIDASLRRRSAQVLARALRDSTYLTRMEISRAHGAAGIEATGQRLAHILMHAELDALICSGPLRGKQFTYALLDERAPSVRKLGREEALGELTQRFFAHHGPATVKDLAWWSGLTKSDARRGIESVEDRLQSETLDRTQFYLTPSSNRPKLKSSVIRLLPNYDEYLIAYRDQSLFLDRSRVPPVRNDALAAHFITLDGRIVGGWRRKVTKDGIAVRGELFGRIDVATMRAVRAEFERYSEFLGKKVEVELQGKPRRLCEPIGSGY